MDFTSLMPNKSPEPTAVGAVRSAIAVHVAFGGGSAFFVRHHYTLMKNKITITLSVAGLLAFLFFVDITYWHIFGYGMLQFKHHMEFVVALFYVGLVLSFLATLLAATSLPRHWRSGSSVGWFICSFAEVAGFFWLLATGL